ncbi:hypothetical protein R3P38DRAFT_2790685 [Favolaschia claudopus]|uniref:Uncharacterized protein n=1 Tax=Favolaschia claudopus TaxID=2862362 RepID=A0AAW0AI37_9AGAR
MARVRRDTGQIFDSTEGNQVQRSVTGLVIAAYIGPVNVRGVDLYLISVTQTFRRAAVRATRAWRTYGPHLILATRVRVNLMCAAALCLRPIIFTRPRVARITVLRSRRVSMALPTLNYTYADRQLIDSVSAHMFSPHEIASNPARFLNYDNWIDPAAVREYLAEAEVKSFSTHDYCLTPSHTYTPYWHYHAHGKVVLGFVGRKFP